MICRIRQYVALVVLALASCDPTPYREVRVDLTRAQPAAAPEHAGPTPLRFSVATMESPRGTYRLFSRVFELLGAALGTDVELVQRRTYREVNELLLSGRIDAALVCTGGYLDLLHRAPASLEILAVPVVRGETTYRALVLVPATSGAGDLDDLRGMRFAFTDELSFSGHLYVEHALRRGGHDPHAFFGTAVFTGSHDRSIEAVARHIVDGAAVNGAIYEQLVARDAGLEAATRVIHRSAPFGAMPVVASPRLDAARRARLRDVLLGLHSDTRAASALAALHIDRFERPREGLYETAAAAVEGAR